MLKSIALGLLTVVIGPWIGFVLSLLTGLIIEPVAEKKLAELSLKRFRHAWGSVWIGFAIGILNSLSIYFFELNGIVLLVIFVIYFVFFLRPMKIKTQFVFYELCTGDQKQFTTISRRTEIITFLSYLIGLYGLGIILQT